MIVRCTTPPSIIWTGPSLRAAYFMACHGGMGKPESMHMGLMCSTVESVGEEVTRFKGAPPPGAPHGDEVAPPPPAAARRLRGDT